MTVINPVIKGKQPVIDTLNVTPTTSAQQITAPQGTDGYSPVNVSAVTSSIDANIVAGNIKKDVQILGVTGSYEGTVPTGTINISQNGIVDVTNYASADVQVPTTAPAYYIDKTKDANNKLVGGSTVINLTGVTDVDAYGLSYAYAGNTSITGTVDFSSLTSISGYYALNNCFSGCTGITGINLSGLTVVSGSNSCQSVCRNCTGITSVDLSNLKNVAQNAFNQAFNGCTGLTSINIGGISFVKNSSAFSSFCSGCSSLNAVNLGSLNVVRGATQVFQYAFSNCTGLTSIDLSSLIHVSSTNVFGGIFSGCTNLTSVNLSSLAKIGTYNDLSQAFQNCTSLASLSFPNLAYTATNMNGAFPNMLQGVTGCTVHFPAEWQTDMSSWSNVTNGFGGTNTTVLFDLPNVTTLDLTCLTKIEEDDIFNSFAQNNYFPNITSVDLSNLTTIGGTTSCQNMFRSCTGITSVNLNSLGKIIGGAYSCQNMFTADTGLTSIDLSSLTEINGNSSCMQMFLGCTGIITVDLSGLTTIGGLTDCQQMFQGCTGITSLTFDSLEEINGSSACYTMFSGCTSLTTLSFPALKTVLNNQVFSNMLLGVTGCTVHFPSNLSSYNFNVGGTNTTVLYDLPATN